MEELRQVVSLQELMTFDLSPQSSRGSHQWLGNTASSMFWGEWLCVCSMAVFQDTPPCWCNWQHCWSESETNTSVFSLWRGSLAGDQELLHHLPDELDTALGAAWSGKEIDGVYTECPPTERGSILRGGTHRVPLLQCYSILNNLIRMGSRGLLHLFWHVQSSHSPTSLHHVPRLLWLQRHLGSLWRFLDNLGMHLLHHGCLGDGFRGDCIRGNGRRGRRSGCS